MKYAFETRQQTKENKVTFEPKKQFRPVDWMTLSLNDIDERIDIFSQIGRDYVEWTALICFKTGEKHPSGVPKYGTYTLTVEEINEIRDCLNRYGYETEFKQSKEMLFLGHKLVIYW